MLTLSPFSCLRGGRRLVLLECHFVQIGNSEIAKKIQTSIPIWGSSPIGIEVDTSLQSLDCWFGQNGNLEFAERPRTVVAGEGEGGAWSKNDQALHSLMATLWLPLMLSDPALTPFNLCVWYLESVEQNSLFPVLKIVSRTANCSVRVQIDL